MGSSKEKETGIGYAKKLGVQFSWKKAIGKKIHNTLKHINPHEERKMVSCEDLNDITV
jgi:hypothetical protein